MAELLSIPKHAGTTLLKSGGVRACRLLSTDRFIKFCKDRSVSINRERLFRLERLKLFAPVFRVKTPDKDIPSLELPTKPKNPWFSEGWAWDTTVLNSNYEVPDNKDREQEGYYSVFQVDYLAMVLTDLTLSLHLDSFLEAPQKNWEKSGKKWMEYAENRLGSLKTHEHRKAIALMCQFIRPILPTDAGR